jgi:hypothetical protein
VSWEHLSEEDLLQVRICDLRLRIKGSDLAPRVAQLHEELAEKGLPLMPHCYLSDEWQCPDGEAAIGIPFYLAHPRLKALEFRMMFEVEGGTPTWCMKLLRHEAGHAYDHAYRLSRRDDWRRVFGNPRMRYSPYFYQVDPESKRHVRNVPDNYAQCHPVEDFAETFAVWLAPNSQWKTRYAGWPATRKLRYVDRLMKEVAKRRAPGRKPVLHAEARTMQSTLKSYYERKFRVYQLGDLSFASRQLREIFRPSRSASPLRPASALIRRYKRRLVDSIAEWSGERPSQVENVVAALARLCDEARLVVRDPVEETLLRLSSFVTTLVVNRQRGYSYKPSRP